ncbi:MCE family protein [uncultured Thermomonospora sp.]|uniref:MCE family protein n=1 Tax=uncultured Thermomonospora sp. TaxID=671175 RepID=UPI00259B2974|nr:MCE family protein [uncultured Thermomonospora sp.]
MRRSAAVATALAVTLAAGGTGCSVQTAGAPKGGMTLSATFEDVQTLTTGHSVQISDVKVGTVTKIELSGYRALVTMSLEKGRRIPTGTTATISRTSLLGENYVRLDPPPGRDLSTGPFLPDGAHLSATSVQPDLEQITERVGPLLAAISGQNLQTITSEGATAVSGKGKQLNTLIKKAAQVTDSYAAANADLARALDALAELGGTLEGGRDRLDKLPGNLQLATQRLKNERAQLKRSVQELLKLARSINDNVHLRHGKRLEAVLRRAEELIDAAVRGREQLKALTLSILKLLKGPSVSYSGQALVMVWLKGFLPPAGGASAAQGRADSGGPLRDLLEPRS